MDSAIFICYIVLSTILHFSIKKHLFILKNLMTLTTGVRTIHLQLEQEELVFIVVCSNFSLFLFSRD